MLNTQSILLKTNKVQAILPGINLGVECVPDDAKQAVVKEKVRGTERSSGLKTPGRLISSFYMKVAIRYCITFMFCCGLSLGLDRPGQPVAVIWLFFQACITVSTYLIIVCIFGMNRSIRALQVCKPAWLVLSMRRNPCRQRLSRYPIIYANDFFSFYTPYRPWFFFPYRIPPSQVKCSLN